MFTCVTSERPRDIWYYNSGQTAVILNIGIPTVLIVVTNYDNGIGNYSTRGQHSVLHPIKYRNPFYQ